MIRSTIKPTLRKLFGPIDGTTDVARRKAAFMVALLAYVVLVVSQIPDTVVAVLDRDWVRALLLTLLQVAAVVGLLFWGALLHRQQVGSAKAGRTSLAIGGAVLSVAILVGSLVSLSNSDGDLARLADGSYLDGKVIAKPDGAAAGDFVFVRLDSELPDLGSGGTARGYCGPPGLFGRCLRFDTFQGGFESGEAVRVWVLEGTNDAYLAGDQWKGAENLSRLFLAGFALCAAVGLAWSAAALRRQQLARRPEVTTTPASATSGKRRDGRVTVRPSESESRSRRPATQMTVTVLEALRSSSTK